MNDRGYTVLPLADGVWAIQMQMVRAFLVAGDVSAVLVDTGAGGVNLKAAVCEVTALPVRVVNTHAHFDHISGNKAGFQARPVGDGAGFDLGGRILQVVSLPGHTPGSIGLWDAEAGLLFAGDTVARSRPVFLCLDGASVEAYLRSMDRILQMEHDEHGGKLSRIFCAHGDVETDLSTVRKLRECAARIAAGELPKEPLPDGYASFLPDIARICRYEDVSILINE